MYIEQNQELQKLHVVLLTLSLSERTDGQTEIRLPIFYKVLQTDCYMYL